MKIGADGYLYLTGTTRSADFPVTAGAFRAPGSGGARVFVAKLRLPDLSAVYYSLLDAAADEIYDPEAGETPMLVPAQPLIAVDGTGSAYVAVSTRSVTWPTTSGGTVPPCPGSAVCSHVIVAKLSPTGDRLVYCTYLGGDGQDAVGGIAVSSTGNAYVTGSTTSRNFPVTAGAFQRERSASDSSWAAAFLTRLSPDGTYAEYSTYVDGSRWDRARSIAVDAQGVAYIAGSTTSPDFPVRNAVQAGLVNRRCAQYTNSGSIPYAYTLCGSSGFVAAVNADGSALLWSTNIGSGRVFAFARDTRGTLLLGGVSLSPVPISGGSASVVRYDPARRGLQLYADSITNAASFRSGLPHPGGLASMFVEGLDISGSIVAGPPPLPLELAGVSISVDGRNAPILAVADIGNGKQQINFQVPFDAKSTTVEVRSNGLSTFIIPETTAPGIFTLPARDAAIQHADGSLVVPENPARAGEVIVVYGTGFGPVRPEVTTGDAATGPAALNPDCGVRARAQVPLGTIEYLGITPGYPGLYQLNVRLPAAVDTGSRDFWIWWPDCWPIGVPPDRFARSNTVRLHLR
jgi:uncharacterized protein (TIGR03437 family)